MFEIKRISCRPIYRPAVDNPMPFEMEKPYGDVFNVTRGGGDARQGKLLIVVHRGICEIIIEILARARLSLAKFFPSFSPGSELNFLI